MRNSGSWRVALRILFGYLRTPGKEDSRWESGGQASSAFSVACGNHGKGHGNLADFPECTFVQWPCGAHVMFSKVLKTTWRITRADVAAANTYHKCIAVELENIH